MGEGQNDRRFRLWRGSEKGARVKGKEKTKCGAQRGAKMETMSYEGRGARQLKIEPPRVKTYCEPRALSGADTAGERGGD